MGTKKSLLTPASRLVALRAYLESAGGATVAQIARRFEVSRPTVGRDLAALSASGAVVTEREGPEGTVYHVASRSAGAAVPLTTSELTALHLAVTCFEHLAGTGLKEDLESAYAKLAATLRERDFALAKNLKRKIFDVNEAPHLYEGHGEIVDEIVTGLLKEERLDVRRETDREPFVVEPYTLVLYKKGLYLLGRSERHGGVRMFGLDRLADVTWRRGDRFDYPDGFDPKDHVGGGFGLVGGGPRTEVRIAFEPAVTRYVTRRRWHATQELVPLDGGGIELRLTVDGTVELVGWILGFGGKARVLSPRTLIDEVAREAEAMLRACRGAQAATPVA